MARGVECGAEEDGVRVVEAECENVARGAVSGERG